MNTRTIERRLPVVKDSTLRARVVELLKEAIFSGKLQPGESLVEMQIARELEVSQATVREALVQLEQSGLVVRIPNRATMVTRFSPKEIAERVRIRIALEAMALAEAAPLLEEKDFEELERRMAALHQAAAQGDQFLRVQADLNFHSYIWERSGNLTLSRMLHQVTAPMFAFASILRKRGLVTWKSVENPHEDIIRALRTRDQGVIHAAIEQHIRTTYEPFLAVDIDAAPCSEIQP